MDNLNEKLINILSGAKHEGTFPYLYLDTKGNLTSGVGHNWGFITNDYIVEKLKNKHLYKNGKELNQIEIEKLINELKAFYLEKKDKTGGLNYKADYFKNKYGIYFNTDDIYDELNRDVNNAIKDAKTRFNNFTQLNQNIQIALCVLAFAMGASRLKKFSEELTQFKEFIENKKFKEASNLIDKISAWNSKARKDDVKKLLTR